MDRLLDGPTNDSWLTPWHQFLTSKGVEYHTNAPVWKLEFDDKQITGAVAGGKLVTADYYIAAFPDDVMGALATDDLMEAEPALSRLTLLRTRWMNGIQFFLK